MNANATVNANGSTQVAMELVLVPISAIANDNVKTTSRPKSGHLPFAFTFAFTFACLILHAACKES